MPSLKMEFGYMKKKNPTPGLVVMQFVVFSQEAENKVLMWSLDLFGLFSGNIMEFSASEEISTLGLSFSWIQLTNSPHECEPCTHKGTA